MPARALGELQRGALHVHLRLRAGGRALGRLPLRRRRASPTPSTCSCRCPPGLEPAAVASASDNISDAWRAVGPALAEEPGADVLVVGGAGSGSIGLYAAGLAVALGAASVLYVDADAGAATIADGARRADARRDRRSASGPFPITVDASADPDGLALALRSTAPDGTCTSTAIYFGEQPSLPLLEMYTKGITFRTGRANAREAMPHVLDAGGRGRAASRARHDATVVAWDDARRRAQRGRLDEARDRALEGALGATRRDAA